MNALQTTLLVGFGGFLGANARYWLGVSMVARLGEAFPWHTLAANVSGCFLLGALFGLTDNQAWRLFLLVGVLGGYTTFSSFSLETVQMMQKGQALTALAYVMASVVVCLLATWAGLALFARAA